MGLGLVLKTKGAVKGLGVGTSFLRTMVTILKKEGQVLNPNDKVVNDVLKMIEIEMKNAYAIMRVKTSISHQ